MVTLGGKCKSICSIEYMILDLQRMSVWRERTSRNYALPSQTSLCTRIMSSVTLEWRQIFSLGSSGHWRHCHLLLEARHRLVRVTGVGEEQRCLHKDFYLLTRICRRRLRLLLIGGLDETVVCTFDHHWRWWWWFPVNTSSDSLESASTTHFFLVLQSVHLISPHTPFH